MSNFLVIFACLIAGHLCKHLRFFPASTALSLNSFIIYLSLPAVILTQIPKLLGAMSFQGLWWLPVSMAWLNFLFSYLFFTSLGKKWHWSQAKTGALVLTAGLGNTSFVGFPLLEALIGPEAISIGVLVDQPGSFLVVSSVGIIVAALFSGARITVSTVTRKVFLFPPFLALLLSILWFLTGTMGKEVFMPAFDKIAATLVPLALFAVGFQLRFDLKILRKRWSPLAAGLAFKLILMPATFAILYLQLLGARDLAAQVTVIESAMAPMITASVVAAEFNLDTELANLMVGIGIPLSLLTVPLWNSILF